MTHYLHSLCRINIGYGTGWYAPIELPDSQRSVEYAIPVDSNGVAFDSYIVQVCTINPDNGQLSWSDNNLEKSNEGESFSITINQTDIRFVERRVFPRWRQLNYLGRLRHPDFGLRLIELKPENPTIVDGLLDNNGIVIIGSNPFSQYDGLDDIPRE